MEVTNLLDLDDFSNYRSSNYMSFTYVFCSCFPTWPSFLGEIKSIFHHFSFTIYQKLSKTWESAFI